MILLNQVRLRAGDGRPEVGIAVADVDVRRAVAIDLNHGQRSGGFICDDPVGAFPITRIWRKGSMAGVEPAKDRWGGRRVVGR